MSMTITSYLPGRIRVRDNRFTIAAEAGQITGLLKNLHGITGISVNSRTASLLVQYDPASGVEELLRTQLGLPQAARNVKPVQRRHSSGKKQVACLSVNDIPVTYRQFLNYGMMATFAVSGIGIALHYRKLHALAGFLFFGLSGLHMYNKRRTLFV
jgi:hypothetical protein